MEGTCEGRRGRGDPERDGRRTLVNRWESRLWRLEDKHLRDGSSVGQIGRPRPLRIHYRRRRCNHHHHQVPDLEQTLATMPLQTSLSSDNFKKFKPLLCPPVAELQRLSRNVIRCLPNDRSSRNVVYQTNVKNLMGRKEDVIKASKTYQGRVSGKTIKKTQKN